MFNQESLALEIGCGDIESDADIWYLHVARQRQTSIKIFDHSSLRLASNISESYDRRLTTNKVKSLNKQP